MNDTVTETLTASPKEVRAWALANGFEVGARGRISATVKDAFTKATGRVMA